MRLLSSLAIALFIHFFVVKPAVAQDIAIVGMTADIGKDKFSFVALKNIPAGNVYYFTDDAYNPVTDTFAYSSVESLFAFTSPGLVIGDVIVITEDSVANTIVETCASTVSCGSSVALLDPAFSLTFIDELFCFTSTMPITASFPDIFKNITAIHASFRGSDALNSDPSGNYPNSVNVVLTGQQGQFNVGTRGTVLTTADLSVASNYLIGDASSTVRFSQLNGTTISGAEIQVEGLGNSLIPSGSAAGSCGNNTIFPTTGILGGSSYAYTYTINNLGTAALNLTGTPAVTISGSSAFTLGPQPTNTSIPVGGFEQFNVVFAPTALGPHSATITISNNDSDEGTYTFVVEGEATPDNPVSSIAIVGMSAAVNQFSFVALRDIQPGEVFYFTDDLYDEEANAFIHGNGVESLFKFEPASMVPAGNVIVVTEGSVANDIVITCTDQLCAGTDVVLLDPSFSILGDALYCFTSSDPTDPVTILSTVTQIHASMAVASNSDYSDVNCRYGLACHVQLTSDNAQFTVSLRENTLLTDKAAFENPANYTNGNASSTIPFNRDLLGCGDNFYDNGGDTTVYAPSSMDSYTFCPEIPGEKVSIDFSFVDMETSTNVGVNNTGCYDYLTFYDGDSDAAPLIGTLCGEGDGDGGIPSILSNYLKSGDLFIANNPSGCFTVEFSSDGSVQEEGFEAAITCGPSPCSGALPGDELSTAIPLTQAVYEEVYNTICFTNDYAGFNGKDIYFKFTAPACVDSVYISTCSDSTTHNAGIFLLDAAGVEVVSVAPDTIGCSTLVAGGIVPGTEYYIVVDNYSQAISTFGFTYYTFSAGDSLNTAITVPSLPFTTVNSNDSGCRTDSYNTNSEGGYDVIYQFTTGPCSDSILISTCSDTTDFDTYISLLDSNGNSLYTSDDASSSLCNIQLGSFFRFSVINQGITPNTTYYVVVDGYGNSDQGTFELTIEETIASNLPANTDTTAILLGATFDVAYSTTCMDNNYSGRPGKDLFFTWTQRSSCSDSIYISTCSDTTDFDTYLYLLDDTGTVIASNDDAPSGACSYTLNGANRFSTIRALVQAGKTYTIVVDGYDATSFGNVGLTVYSYRQGNFMGDPIVVPSLPYTDTNNTTCYSNIFDPVNTGDKDVYYKFTTGPCADTISINTCTNTSINTFLYLLDTNGNQVYNNNDFCGDQSRIKARITPNTTYFLVVDGFFDFGVYELNIEEICRPGVMVSPKLFLEGNYDPATSLMFDDLRSQNIIPLNEPFTGLGFTHIGGGGGEATTSSVFNTIGNDAIVDWVFVELRDALDPSMIIATRSAFLQRDGDVVEHRYGVGPVEFTNLPDGNYYVAVRSRNHLAVCSASAFTLSETLVTTVDFTGGVAYGTNAMKSYSSGAYALYEGDLDADAAINAADRSNAWNLRNTTGAYISQDSNLDGVCNALERSNAWNNRNLTAQLP